MSGILKTIRRMFRGNTRGSTHKEPFANYSKKTDNFTSYVEEYGASVNSDGVSDDGFSNVSFASPLESQDSTYDIPSSVYQIPPPLKDSVASLSNNTALDNLGKGLQEPIYSTIKKTKDMGSQTELDFPSSNSSSLCSSAIASNSSISSSLARTTPPLPPPPDFFNTVDPLALYKERKKNNGNEKKSLLEQKPKNPQDEMISELKKTLERRRKASSSED